MGGEIINLVEHACTPVCHPAAAGSPQTETVCAYDMHEPKVKSVSFAVVKCLAGKTHNIKGEVDVHSECFIE